MRRVLSAHARIYDHIQNWSSCHWTDRANDDDYITYGVGKDTVEETAQALLAHREKGFASDIHERYIEYYGVLQAIYMQQDAINALYRLFASEPLDVTGKPNWNRIRDLRNDTVGHPVGCKRFLNQCFMAYDRVNTYWWDKSSRCPKSEDVPLAALIDGYATEATDVLDFLHKKLEADCPTKHT